MKHKKPLIIKIVIWMCVLMMVLSLLWVYIGSMSSQKWAWENLDDVDTWDLQVITWDVEVEEILPEINPEEPENTEAPILMAEDEESDEMDETFEIQLENWETELISQWDLWTDITIN